MSAAKGETAIFYVTRDHTLWGYGSSQFGQIGMENGHASSPIPLMHNIVFIDAGHDTPFAIDEKGQLWTWGDENPAKGKPIKPEPSVSVFPTRLVNIADNIEQVSSSFSHTLALARDGTLLAWGDNQSGSLGDGTNIDRAHPVKVDTSALGKRKIIKIATRMGESFAVTDGRQPVELGTILYLSGRTRSPFSPSET